MNIYHYKCKKKFQILNLLGVHEPENSKPLEYRSKFYEDFQRILDMILKQTQQLLWGTSTRELAVQIK